MTADKPLRNRIRSAGEYIKLAKSNEAKGEFSESIINLREAARKGADDLYVAEKIADLYIKKGQEDEAVSEIEKYLKNGADSYVLRNKIAVLYMNAGKYDKALIHLKRSLEISSETDPSTYINIAEAHLRCGEPDLSLKNITKALKKDKNITIPPVLYEILEKTGDLQPLINCIELSENKDERDYIKLGRLYRRSGNRDLSVNCFNNALRISTRKDMKSFQNQILNEIEISESRTSLESKPRSLVASLTSRCNLKCSFCEVKDENWDIKEKTVKEIKDLLPYLQYVTWQGGEVFMSQHFRGLYETAAAMEDLSQNIPTNALMLDEKWIALFKEGKVNLVLSIDGFTDASYEKTRIGGEFSKLKEILSMLSEHKKSGNSDRGLDYSMQVVIQKENYKDIPRIIPFMRKYKITRLQLLPLNCTVNNPDGIFTDKDIRYQLQDNLNELEHDASRSGIKVINALPVSARPARNKTAAKEVKIDNECINNTHCLWPWQQLSMYSGGGVTVHCFCVHMKMGNVKDMSLMEIWNNIKFRKIRQKILDDLNKGICNDNCISGQINKDALQLDY